MKVLWITNILLPEAECLLSSRPYSLTASGGWLVSSSDVLSKSDGVELAIVCVSDKVKSFTQISGSRIKYYIIPNGRSRRRSDEHYNKKFTRYCELINNVFTPDIVHIHGTEYSLGLSYCKTCGSENVVISIQGILSVYAFFYNAGMTLFDIARNVTFKDIFIGGILRNKMRFVSRSRYETEMIRMVPYIIGRTEWDKTYAMAINPVVKYFKCNESLRGPFYSGQWRYSECVPHSIFISQANYPIKGFHMLIKALPSVLRKYPDTVVKVAGRNIVGGNTLSNKLRRSGYGKYLCRMIEKYSLQDKVFFLGPLSDVQMKEQYLQSNVFVCPSSIENSPNSVGEAQILGVPCIASYVGGIPSMITGPHSGLMYRFEDYQMLSELICKIFSSSSSYDNTEERIIALQRHNVNENNSALLYIYKQIIKQ